MRVKMMLIAVIFLMISGVTFAQSLKIGGKVGASLYKIDGVSFSDEFKWGYHAGGFIEAMWSKTMGIQPEVLFSQANTRTATQFSQLYQTTTSNLLGVKLNYLSIPVLLNIRPVSFITFQAGPQFSVLMNQDRTLLQNGQDAFKNNNLTLLGGVQLNLFQFRIYGRYGIGLTNINDIDQKDKWKSQSIQIGAGITL